LLQTEEAPSSEATIYAEIFRLAKIDKKKN
jgi:hypothetical protein